MTNVLLKAVMELACGFCVVWRIGGQKSHPEFHRVRGDCLVYRPHFSHEATSNHRASFTECPCLVGTNPAAAADDAGAGGRAARSKLYADGLTVDLLTSLRRFKVLKSFGRET